MRIDRDTIQITKVTVGFLSWLTIQCSTLIAANNQPTMWHLALMTLSWPLSIWIGWLAGVILKGL